MFEGKVFKFGDRQLTIPPISVKQLKAMKDDFEKLKQRAETAVEAFERALPFIHAAVMRNYPEMTLTDLEELLDMGNFAEVQAAVLGQSGFKPASPNAQSPQTATN